MKYEPVKDHAERKRISALIEQCEKEQTMSRWINAEWLLNFFEPYPDDYQTPLGTLRACVDDAPSIDIIRCKECKHSEYREDFDDYECHASGCGLVYDAEFYCADGEYKENE